MLQPLEPLRVLPEPEGTGALAANNGDSSSSKSNGTRTVESRWPPALLAVWISSLGCILVRHGRMPWQAVSRHATQDLTRLDEVALDGWAPARISWAAYPTKCWKVDAEVGKFHNGMRLAIMDCAY